MDISNESDVPFSVWSDACPDQSLLTIQPGVNTPRWTLSVERYCIEAALYPESLRVSRLIADLNARLRLKWSHLPGRQGRLDIGEGLFATRNSVDHRISDIEEHFKWLEAPTIAFDVRIEGKDVHRIEGLNTYTKYTYKLPRQQPATVVVNINIASTQSSGPGTLLLLPFTFAEKGSLTIPSGLAWIGTLERSINISAKENEKNHTLPIMAIQGGEAFLCVALIDWGCGEVWWHNTPIALDCD
eukprot:GHVO01023215.1.p1 GENE.GHVO01023215.1~~GHVO01023215.1.p1  ORF type:complete len:261 (+),score=55.20 GHVO01023215.1:56-784(+)